MSKSKFEFFCPLEIKKAKDEDGQEVLRIGGIASTMDEDSDGEFLDPKGFVLEEFLDYGIVNWHHQAKDKPSTIIGEPVIAEIRKEGLYVECELYPDSEMAREVYELAKVMKSNSKRRKLGFSIEGSVIEKDPLNDKIIKKAVITGLAITHMPKNPKTFADIIKGKGILKEDEEDVEKSLDTQNGAALTKESVNYEIKDLTEEKFYDEIFKAFPDIEIEKAQEFYNVLNQIKEAMSKKTVSPEQLTKAMDVLGFSKNEVNPFLQKAAKKDKTPEEVADEVQAAMFKTDDEMEEEGKLKKGKQPDPVENPSQETPAGEAPELEGNDPIQKGKASASGEILIMKKIFEKGMRENAEISKAVGVVTKAVLESNQELLTEVKALKKSHTENEATIAELHAELSKANTQLGRMSGGAPQRKSIITKGFAEKESFDKAKIEAAAGDKPTLSKSRDFKVMLDIVDKFAEQKGYRADLSKAVMDFEATKQLPKAVELELSNELGVLIVD